MYCILSKYIFIEIHIYRNTYLSKYNLNLKSKIKIVLIFIIVTNQNDEISRNTF